jgi:tetratricopeptide (TPR) repeat protein/DNA-binding XRE family transcriptional regulator
MDTSPSISWNERLRKERVQHNWRQQDVADRLGTTVLTVKRWERGNQQPSAYFRLKICTLFGKSAEELGFFQDNHQPPVSTEAPVPIQSSSISSDSSGLWNIPYPRNPFFTGREDLLYALHEQLNREHTMALTQSWAISGLGGIGKTQLALEYAYRYRQNYHSIFWISAATRETLQNGFTKLADLLQLPEKDERDHNKIMQAVKHWLATHQNWLLILDNADDITVVQDLVPSERSGHLLLTTRAQTLGSVAQRLDVETMDMAEGALFLLRRAKLLAPEATLDCISETDLKAAEAIIIEMDCLPLALDQAGAYIEEARCTLEMYLELYRIHRKELLQRRGQMPTDHPEPVATTWSLSFQKIEQTNPAAAELVQLCAFLAPDHIPEELIKEGAPYWPPLLQQAASDLLTFNQMLEDLLSLSLAKRLAKDHLLSIHRLVQAVHMDEMEPEEQRQWAERVVRAVNAIFPRDPKDDVTSWPLCLRYLEQVQACDILIQKHSLAFPEAADLLDRSGTYLREHASYTLAEVHCQRALSIHEQHLGPHHLSTAQSLNNLGILYHRQGKYEQAESLYMRAISIREQHLGPHHPDTAKTLNNLGILYWRQGKHEQAESLCIRALSIYEQHWGPHHPLTAGTLSNLGLLYWQQGKYEQAEPLYVQALSIREQHLGPHHPLTAGTLSNLGLLYFHQGKYDQAEPLYVQALSIREQHLGPQHSDTAETLNNLGLLYFQKGKYEQAESLLVRAHSIREQHFGPHHPDTAEVLNNLGLLYFHQDKYEQAESLLVRALDIQEQTLASHHPDLATTLHGLAHLYETQGDPQKAVTLYQQALTIREQVYGSQHAKTIETRESISTTMHQMRESKKEVDHNS